MLPGIEMEGVSGGALAGSGGGVSCKKAPTLTIFLVFHGGAGGERVAGDGLRVAVAGLGAGGGWEGFGAAGGGGWALVAGLAWLFRLKDFNDSLL
jgi:hypothetical protein